MRQEKWLDKPYYSLDAYMKYTYGQKVYKIAVDAGLTCPNRDGTLGERGCIFVVPAEAAISQCQSQVVAGRMDRAWLVLRRMAVCTSIGRNGIRAGHRQRFIIRNMSAGEAASMWSGKRLISNGRWNVAWRSSIRRSERSSSFISGIHEHLWRSGILGTHLAGSIRRGVGRWNQYCDKTGLSGDSGSIGSCKKAEMAAVENQSGNAETVISILGRLQKEYAESGKFIWIELGLQTMHEATAEYIRRGYLLSTYETAIQALADNHIPYITHVILGLPGETEDDMLATVRYVCGQQAKPFGIKLQLLHVLRGTDLCGDYEAGSFEVLSQDEYIELVIKCLEVIPEDIVIHRVTGDGPKIF